MELKKKKKTTNQQTSDSYSSTHYAYAYYLEEGSPLARSHTETRQESTMASSCNRQYFLNPRLSLRLVILLWTVMWAVSAKERAADIYLRGEVGGNVTFHCPVDKTRTVIFFYFQIKNEFVNGYYKTKDITRPVWENTRVDCNETAVHMYGLNISHSGKYECIIQYADSTRINEAFIELSVTANYSKPTITTFCDGENLSCLVTCSSHGGYPRAKMIWNGPMSENTTNHMLTIVNSSEVPNPVTMMFNSSSTANFNCSNGQLTGLSCSVGDVTSDVILVCTPKVPPVLSNVIVGFACVVPFVLLLGLLLYCKCKKRQRGQATMNGRTVNGGDEEAIGLNTI
uniref:Ig-like domain-containing protein n=2 Tax=Lates calcarifer TaxID=8187 RepID=A0A4W6F674_LATCA